MSKQSNLVNNSQDVTVDASGNVGIGVVPESWAIVSPALSVGKTSIADYSSGTLHFSYLYNNLYYDGTNDRYIADGKGGLFQIADSEFKWFQAGTGTAGSTGALTEAMRIDSSGNVGINYTNPSILGTLVVKQKADAKGIAIIDSASANTFFLENDGTQCNIRNNDSVPITFTTNNSEAMRIDSSGNVGIGAASPAATLHVDAPSTTAPSLTFGAAAGQILGNEDSEFAFGLNNASPYNLWLQGRSSTNDARDIALQPLGGNLLVGKTSADYTTAGVMLEGDGTISSVKAGATAVFNRLSSDGDIALFRKNGTTVGSIGNIGGYLYIGSPQGTDAYIGMGGGQVYPATSTGAYRDNAMDIGSINGRWDDIYATNGTIQTSDRNEKQDIEVLTAAETAVAVACKGLLRKFRWIDAVEEKGDDARIHFGIIAQDLQDAFTAEGLDAGRYAMFISSTWWETQTDVPAVVAVDEVLDEDGNVVTEAVEAKDAYTRTDTFDTLAEAPEGATERTRLGVRYPELLAFIIGAM